MEVVTVVVITVEGGVGVMAVVVVSLLVECRTKRTVFFFLFHNFLIYLY